MPGRTRLDIRGDDFLINDVPTYPGRAWNGSRIEGLLLNSRMVQATFDDLNPETRGRWAYPDTGAWDAERNMREFVAALPAYRRHGLLAVTLNLQGGCPEGYCTDQPWINSGFDPDGSLRADYAGRLDRILGALDDLGMVGILGLFYFGQDERLDDGRAVRRAAGEAIGWVLDRGHTNVVVEVANECDVPRYEHEILQPHRIHALIDQVRATTKGGRRLLAGASFKGRSIPTEDVLAVSDVALLHGNGVTDPEFIGHMVDETRRTLRGRVMPIVVNEDDHYDFDRPSNNMTAALSRHASWGYFDAGKGAGGSSARSDYIEGYQNVPVNWAINTDRKRGFFKLAGEVTGSQTSA